MTDEVHCMYIYLDLFLTFARIGACTFGGGMAMLPILQREIVQRKGWAKNEDLADWFAIGQCTPGIIAVNAATFVGCSRGGMLGGIIATLGVVSPSVVIIVLAAASLSRIDDLPVVAHAFAGIRACVCALIIGAVLKLRKSSVVDLPTALIFIAVLVAVAIFGISPIITVTASGVIGLAFKMIKKARSR